MIGLLQRVSGAQVMVEDACIAQIGAGLLVLIGVQRGDTQAAAEQLLDRLLTYRVFPDAGGRMNLSLQETGGGLLLVPQFTLAADTRKGRRPSFSSAAAPPDGERLYNGLLKRARAAYPAVASGRFGADMKVTLTNDGPVTFWIETR